MDRGPHQSEKSPDRLCQAPCRIEAKRTARGRPPSRRCAGAISIQRMGWAIPAQGERKMICPDCNGELAPKATYCGCGWHKHTKLESEIKQRVPCANDDCRLDAILRLQTKTGWANFCEPCYTKYAKEQARISCEDKGLFTADQKRAWLKTAMKRLMPTVPDDEIPF